MMIKLLISTAAKAVKLCATIDWRDFCCLDTVANLTLLQNLYLVPKLELYLELELVRTFP